MLNLKWPIIKEREMSQIAFTDKIYVAGHRGLVGSAIVRSLKAKV